MASAETAAKPKQFQAEVAKLLHLMVHSVYSEREVFLRELISNASDACDKLRYESLKNDKLMADGGELRIDISFDKKAKVLTIADTGIGMDAKELTHNLGTIARSGTQAFMEELEQGKKKGKQEDVSLIGQFGVGFYSAFMIAEHVDVVSRKAGAKKANIWSSDGTGTFTVSAYDGDDAPVRGTSIRLTLRKDAKEFLDDARLEHIVRTYSDHVSHPIYLGDKQLNSGSAIWARPKSDVSDEQHREFFAHVAGVYGDPALTIHYKAEGRHEYSVLLYVPGEKPFDLFDPERKGRQKLYVRRVYITDEADMLPSWLRFVRGVIDSEDMPLNISREMLQDNPTVHAIRKAVTKRVISELKKCADKQPEVFEKIWSAFGPVIKEGLYEDMERRDDLYGICRFRSTASDGSESVTLADYTNRMKDNQTAIYYLTAEDVTKAETSPQLEGYKARGVEVLLLTDPIDAFWVRTSLGYDGKPLKSVTQGAADLELIPMEDGEKDDKPADDAATVKLLEGLKSALGDKVQDVKKSTRLTSSPVCIVAGEHGFDRTLEKYLARQQGQTAISAPVLEVNATHPLVVQLAERQSKGEDIGDAAQLLLDQAMILEGEAPDDVAGFAERLSKLMQQVYG
ncbi:MAG: molecular chaperone HtpG [Anderseniella sp.]|nr:molecular chaperone HtpG [Anderseniella sp.]